MIEYTYELLRSNRKSISVEINREARIIVRAPLKMSIIDIECFLNSKRKWIDKNLNAVVSKIENQTPKLSDEEASKLKKRAKKELSIRVSYFSNILGVEFNNITVRTQKTRFGSCSTKKNLNFNLAILLMPSEITDYVIVHELAHLKEMNHSERFWSEVERIIPDYREKRKWLKENGMYYINQIV